MPRLGLFLLAASFLALSAPARADAVYDKCVGGTANNAAWSACGSDYIKREDDRLNATWKKVYAQTEGQTRTDLLAEQRLWNAYKEKSCLLFANGDWGREGAVLSFPACRAAVIARRTQALEDFGKAFEPN